MILEWAIDRSQQFSPLYIIGYLFTSRILFFLFFFKLFSYIVFFVGIPFEQLRHFSKDFA